MVQRSWPPTEVSYKVLDFWRSRIFAPLRGAYLARLQQSSEASAILIAALKLGHVKSSDWSLPQPLPNQQLLIAFRSRLNLMLHFESKQAGRNEQKAVFQQAINTDKPIARIYPLATHLPNGYYSDHTAPHPPQQEAHQHRPDHAVQLLISL